jgi:hypothetical protein
MFTEVREFPKLHCWQLLKKGSVPRVMSDAAVTKIYKIVANIEKKKNAHLGANSAR